MRFRPLTKPLKAPRRARVLAAVGLLCVLFAVVFVGFGLVTLPGALVALGLASAIAALALILALYALGRIWQQPAKGALDSLLAIVWALPVIVCAGGLYYVLTQTESYPDLATDTDDPPRFEALEPVSDALVLDSAPPQDRIRIQLAHPDLTTLYIERPGWHIAEVLNTVVANNNWSRARLEQVEDQTFEVEFTMAGPIPLVPHLMAVRIIDDGQGSLIDARAVATTPLHDFGTNARTLRRFLDQLVLSIDATPPPASDL